MNPTDCTSRLHREILSALDSSSSSSDGKAVASSTSGGSQPYAESSWIEMHHRHTSCDTNRFARDDSTKR